MAEPDKKVLTNQQSFSHIEQSMKIIPTPQDVPILIYPGPKSDMANMSKADLEIAERLQRLRRSSKDAPTDEDVWSKLAKLRGKPADYYSNQDKKQHFMPEQRTQTEQADSLLAQVMDEVNLDARAPNPDQDIAARLANLRTEDPPPLGFSQPATIPTVSGSGSAPYGFFGHDADVDMKEVDMLMKMAEGEVLDAQKYVAANKDVISDATASLKKSEKEKKLKKNKKLKKKKKKASVKGDYLTSSDEKHSHSDSEYTDSRATNVSSSKEKEDIDKIVKMYSTKAAKSGGNESSSTDSTSTSEFLSSSSDSK